MLNTSLKIILSSIATSNPVLNLTILQRHFMCSTFFEKKNEKALLLKFTYFQYVKNSIFFSTYNLIFMNVIK